MSSKAKLSRTPLSGRGNVAKLSGIRIEVLYSRRFPKSIRYAEDLLLDLRQAGIEAVSSDVESVAEHWQHLGLRSVPSVVFYRAATVGDPPIGNIVRYAPMEEVLQRAQALAEAEDARDDPASEASSVETLPYQIEASSGAHRYERWNEWYLRDENPATGWCCPSRKQSEYVMLRFDGIVEVSQVRLRPRLRRDGSPINKSFPRGLSLWRVGEQGEDEHLWSQAGIELVEPYDEFVIRFSRAIKVERIKLVIADKHQHDKRGYPSIAHVRVLGQRTSWQTDTHPVRRIGACDFTENLFNKIGLFAGDNVSVELFNLLQGQQTPAFCCSVNKVVIVQEGTVEGQFIPDKTVALKRGDVTVVEPGTSFSLSAVGEKNSVLVIFGTNDLSSVWEAR